MPTVAGAPADGVIAAISGQVVFEDQTPGWVDLTEREDRTFVAGVSVGEGTDDVPAPRADDVEVPVEEGDTLRDIFLRAADLGRAELE